MWKKSPQCFTYMLITLFFTYQFVDWLSTSYCKMLFKPPPVWHQRLFVLHTSVYAYIRVPHCPCICASKTMFDARLYVSAISPVSVDGFLPYFCHWCFLGYKDELIRFWGQRSRSHFHGGGIQHSTLPSSEAFWFLNV